MEKEFVIWLLAFLGVFILVLWCFPSEHTQEKSKLPRWFYPFLPLADLFAQDVGIWLEKILLLWSGRVKKWSDEAGLQWSAARVYGLQMTFALTAAVLLGTGFFLLPVSSYYTVPLVAAMALAAGAYPVIYIRRRAKKRLYHINRILPFAIDLICASMNAGLDFISAVRYYTMLHFDDPLSLEFNILLSEIELGKSRSDALRNMSMRVRAEEFDRFVSAILYSMESGTAIIDVMQLQADEVRRLRFARMEQEIAKVPSKMIIPIVLCIVPSMFILILVPLIMKVKDIGIFQAIFK